MSFRANRTRTQTCAYIVLALAMLGASAARSAEPESSDFPRPTMRSVFQEMKKLVPLSLNEERWQAPAEREAILSALRRLEKSAGALERHGRDREAGFSEIALNLMGDLSESYDYYRTGRYDEARFFFAGSLQSCVACHVRLSSDRSFPLAQELMDESELKALEPRERAWVLVTVRRFDEALSTWEGLIRDPTISASQLDAGGVLADFLNVAIRVRGDIDRATGTLTLFSKRPDQPVYLKRRVREWSDALSKLDSKKLAPGSPGSLDRGVTLARAAGTVADGPYDRDGLVQDLAAASHLVRWLEQDHDRRRNAKFSRNLTASERGNLARAYYWLGVVETRSLDGFWLNLSERHLEAAVRADPLGPIAPKAYSLLEETQVLGYGGSSGLHMPADVWTRLKELRELMGLEE